MIQRLQQIAQTKRGFCLSSTCSQGQKILWQCSKGHQWYSTANSVLHSGSWCPVCAGNQKLSLIELKEIAERKGGKCLATEYINSKTKLPWQCHKRHLWYATAFSIKTRQSWCPECYKSSRNAQLFNPIKNN